jgi:hypothetical protein
MSHDPTYSLIIVFHYKDDMIRATSSFLEEEVRQDLDHIDILWPASRKEVRITYQLAHPLEPWQHERLALMRAAGLCTDFFVEEHPSCGESPLPDEGLGADEDEAEDAALSARLGFDIRDQAQLIASWQRFLQHEQQRTQELEALRQAFWRLQAGEMKP